MEPNRVAGAALVSATGVGVALPNLRALVEGVAGVGLILALMGTVFGVLLLAAGGLLYRAPFTSDHVLRIGGWNTLGVVVLGLVVTLIVLYLDAPFPPFLAANLLAVSSVAHVIIGVRDVQRIRAEDLADERQRSAVLNRLVRHDLRHVAQLLFAYGEQLGADDDPEVAALGAKVKSQGDTLANLKERLDHTKRTIGAQDGTRETVTVVDVVESAVETITEEYPDASVTLDVSVAPDRTVVADDRLRIAVAELVENAITHSDGDTVEVTVTAQGSGVEISVADVGPGVPESYREVITEESAISQLRHGTGIGLWMVKWIVDAYAGNLRFRDDTERHSVVIHLSSGS